MKVNTDQIHLVAGQHYTSDKEGEILLSPAVTNVVVIAKDGKNAVAHAEKMLEKFRVIGSTSLKQYEDVVSNVRSVIAGKSDGGIPVIADDAINSPVNAEQVFWVSGKVGNSDGVKNIVCVANNLLEMLELVKRKTPNFSTLSSNALASYEDAVKKIRGALQGTTDNWRVLIDPQFE